MRHALEILIGDFLERDLPELTPREVDLELLPGKALALIGMRRTGKTFLCYQKIRRLIERGVPKENILYLNFEDDRLFGFQLADCQTILDVFYGLRPEKKSEACFLFFDEIQNVPHWERFIRRLLDTESVSVFITGSSAKLLSAEIATGLRGRSLDREVFPFSFSEYLKAHNLTLRTSQPGHQTRLKWRQVSDEYCRQGGFPELLHLPRSRRHEVAQSYVDAVVFRDVVERHGVSNTEALRSLLYHILRQPAAKLSVHKLYLDFKSRGLRVAKDDLYSFLQYLCDAYLLFQLPIWTRSEKKRQVNPKKIYVIDNGILDAYSTSLTSDRGAFLENLVFLTLRRRGLELGYYETKQGHEVDFVYRDGPTTVLVQAAWTLENRETRLRETRALQEAARDFGQTRQYIITFDEESTEEESAIQILPLWKFLTLP